MHNLTDAVKTSKKCRIFITKEELFLCVLMDIITYHIIICWSFMMGKQIEPSTLVCHFIHSSMQAELCEKIQRIFEKKNSVKLCEICMLKVGTKKTWKLTFSSTAWWWYDTIALRMFNYKVPFHQLLFHFNVQCETI